MNFPATDPLAVRGRPGVAFTNRRTGEAVTLDRAWVLRASIHVCRANYPLGVSPELSVFLADCEPSAPDEAAIIEAARTSARHFTQVRDTLIADLESIETPSGTSAHFDPAHAPEATLTMAQAIVADDPNTEAES
jgi:hypothetical protein